ncbi:MAG: phosphatase PAP2 family protein [Oligoflexia bacterium]|nr:phosphatase PAP2 family protein [Oligoflexia bacterium]
MNKVVVVLCLVIGFISSKGLGQESVGSHISSTLTDGFDRTGLLILGSGALLTAIAFNHDVLVKKAWEDHQRMGSSVSKVGDFWGMGIAQAGIALGQLIFDREKGVPSAEALIASTVVIYGLKYSTQRSRPDSETHNSFPSGHTQIAMASATSIHLSYGLWWALPLYSMGVLTGLSRLSDDAHWLSDVVAGATVGVFFGRAPFKHHGSFLPEYSRSRKGEYFGFKYSYAF